MGKHLRMFREHAILQTHSRRQKAQRRICIPSYLKPGSKNQHTYEHEHNPVQLGANPHPATADQYTAQDGAKGEAAELNDEEVLCFAIDQISCDLRGQAGDIANRLGNKADTNCIDEASIECEKRRADVHNGRRFERRNPKRG